jgi:hypothetical protein
VFAGFQRALFQPLLKNKEDGGAGKVADVPENVPGRLRVALAETELLFHRAQQARAARVQNPSFNLFAFLAVPIQKPVDELLDALANHFRHVFVENDVESGITQIKSHRAQRVWKGVGFRHQDLRTGSFLSGNDYRGGAVSE